MKFHTQGRYHFCKRKGGEQNIFFVRDSLKVHVLSRFGSKWKLLALDKKGAKLRNESSNRVALLLWVSFCLEGTRKKRKRLQKHSR